MNKLHHVLASAGKDESLIECFSCPKRHQVKCDACRFVFAERSQTSVLKRHALAAGHAKKLLIWNASKATQDSIDGMLGRMGNQCDADIATRRMRFSYVKKYVMAGTPFTHFDIHRSAIEEHSGKSMTHSTNLAKFYIPMVSEEESDLIMKEIFQHAVAVISDGTGMKCVEHMCVLFRFVMTYPDKPPMVVQRLVALKMTGHSYNAMQLAGCLHAQIQKFQADAVFNIFDSCAVNPAANDVLLQLGDYTCIPAHCISHTVSNSGKEVFK